MSRLFWRVLLCLFPVLLICAGGWPTLGRRRSRMSETGHWCSGGSSESESPPRKSIADQCVAESLAALRLFSLQSTQLDDDFEVALCAERILRGYLTDRNWLIIEASMPIQAILLTESDKHTVAIATRLTPEERAFTYLHLLAHIASGHTAPEVLTERREYTDHSVLTTQELDEERCANTWTVNLVDHALMTISFSEEKVRLLQHIRDLSLNEGRWPLFQRTARWLERWLPYYPALRRLPPFRKLASFVSVPVRRSAPTTGSFETILSGRSLDFDRDDCGIYVPEIGEAGNRP